MRCKWFITCMSKTIFVTGVTGAIGEAFCTTIIQEPGIHLILAGRNEKSISQLATSLNKLNNNATISTFPLDLSLSQQVLKAPDQIAARFTHIDLLINMGAVFLNKRIVTAEGLETMYATNFKGTCLLTQGLISHFPSLQVITVAGAKPLAVTEQFIKGEPSTFNMVNFLRSKTATMLFAKKMAALLAPTGGTSILYDPGIVKSKSFSTIPFAIKVVSALLSQLPEKAANGLVKLVINNNLANYNGQFLNKKLENIKVPYLQKKEAQDMVYRFIQATIHHHPA